MTIQKTRKAYANQLVIFGTPNYPNTYLYKFYFHASGKLNRDITKVKGKSY